MNRLTCAIVCTGLILTLSACSSKENSNPPAQLKRLDNPLAVTIAWDVDTDAVENKASYNLRPLLIDDQIFTIDVTGNLVNINASNGKENWEFETQLTAITGLAGNQQVILVSSSDGDIAVYDRVKNGLEVRWSTRLSGEIRSIPAINGSQVFVRTVAGKLSAISLVDGNIQWTVSRRIPALSLTGNSSPIVDGNRVIVGFDDGKLAAFDRNNGRTIWEKTISHASGRTEIERLVDIDGDFLLKDGIIYVSSYQGHLAAVQSINGNVIWSRQFSSYQPIVADDDALYISGDMSHIWSIDRRTGTAFWKQEELHGRKITAPQIIEDKIVIGDFEGYVHWLDKKDGVIRGRIRASESRFIAQPVRWQNYINMLDNEGRLFAVSTR